MFDALQIPPFIVYVFQIHLTTQIIKRTDVAWPKKRVLKWT